MKDFVTYLVKNIVDKPEEVEVSVTEKEKELLVEVKVCKEDIAKVVGRQGRTIRSLRTIAGTIGARFGRKIRLDVLN